MSGIAGVIDFNGKRVTQLTIEKMCNVMVHGESEVRSIFCMENVGFGDVKPLVTDYLKTSRRPLTNESKDVRVILNGRLYNSVDLKKTLGQRRHRFRSMDDWQVVVHGYQEWKERIFAKLDGMFALAIWDKRKKRLLLARDRFGRKPLFYHFKNNELIFASDIKGMLEALSFTPAVSPEAIDCYLRYLYVPGMYCVFEGVKKVLPGSFVEFNQDGAEKTYQYWDISYLNKSSLKKEGEYLEIIEEKLKQAIRKRLKSNIPLGILLSGGVDSSLITALLSTMSTKRIKSFSVRFKDKAYDEARYSRIVAERHDTNHTELEVDSEAVNVLPKLVWYYGEPFANSSAIPCYFAFREAKKYTNTVLTGDGGDELFGGYLQERAFYFAEIYRKLIPELIRGTLLPSLVKKFDRGVVWKKDKIRHLIRFVQYGKREPADAYVFSMRSGWLPEHRHRLYTRKFLEELLDHSHNPDHLYKDLFIKARATSDMTRLLYADIKSFLPDNSLVKIGVASTANSVEARTPFLDYELADFVNKIPGSVLVKHGIQKYLLKKLAGKYLPRSLIYRKKMGFSIPIEKWTKGSLSKRIKRILLSSTQIKRGLFNKDYTMFIFDQHSKGKEDHSHRIWSLLWLEIWFRLFIDKSIDANTLIKDLG